MHRRRSIGDVPASNGLRGPTALRGATRPTLSGAVPLHGFDNGINISLVVAIAVVVLVRPRELNFLRLLPFLVPIFLVSLHLASRTVGGLKSVRIPFLSLVVVAYFLTSTAWSGAPVLSVAESLVIVCIAGTASLVASFGNLRDVIGGLIGGCLAVLAVSIAVGLAVPAYGLVPAGYQVGSLRGIMLDRNSLSFVLVVGLIATLVFEFRGRSPRLIKMVICGLFFGGVLWTTSSTCLILSVVSVILALELALLRRVPAARRGRAFACGTFATLVGALYITAHFDELLRVVERDSTFTGRTAVWPVVENLISKEPWLGQGWGAVWGNEALRLELARAIGFEVPHAHNGYLDLQLQVGAIGLGLVLLLLVVLAIRGVGFYLTSDSSVTSWQIILTVVLLLYNRVETSFPAPFSLFLMFATLVALGGATERRERKWDGIDGSHTCPSAVRGASV
jgi:exopolysaccharide production protein ExoQ